MILLLNNKCSSLLSIYKDYVVVFARKQANVSVHALTQTIVFHAYRSTFDIISICIASIVINEIP
jgi:hypothetical protein